MIPALIAAALLSLVHIYGVRLTFSPSIPRSHWLSIAGGTAVAFVFVHILPELGRGQEAVEESGHFVTGFLEQHVYLVALLGLLAFYGLEKTAKAHAEDGNLGEAGVNHYVFWVHIGSYAVYNAIIGYLLLHRDAEGAVGLATFTFALMLHFFVNDHALRELHQDAYHDLGRWLLAGAVFVGWGVGLLVDVSEAMIGVLFAFVAGALTLNVLNEELPRDRESRYWAFALGAVVYSLVLVLVE